MKHAYFLSLPNSSLSTAPLAPGPTTFIYIDEGLSWKEHTNENSEMVASSIGTPHASKLIPRHAHCDQDLQDLDEPHIDYSSAGLDGSSQRLGDNIQKLQHRDAGVNIFISKMMSYDPHDDSQPRQELTA